MSSLPVRNAGDHALCLFIEPYGEDYWLNPGDRFTILPPEGIDARFDVTVTPELLSVWIYQGDDDRQAVADYKITDEHGVELACGHQRPAGPTLG